MNTKEIEEKLLKEIENREKYVPKSFLERVEELKFCKCGHETYKHYEHLGCKDCNCRNWSFKKEAEKLKEEISQSQGEANK